MPDMTVTRLLPQNWHWPKETWFQMRLRDLQKLSKNFEEFDPAKVCS